MNRSYNTPYMDKYPPPDGTARCSILNPSFNIPPTAAVVETSIENSHEDKFPKEELSTGYFSLNNFDTQFLEKRGRGLKLINLDQQETVNKEQATSSNRSFEQGKYDFNKSASFDPYHQNEIRPIQFQEKCGQPLINLDHHEIVNKEQATSSNKSFDQSEHIFNKSAVFDPCHQKETHLIQFQEKGVQRKPQQKMSLEKRVLERSSRTAQLMYNNQGRITKNNSGLKFERQEEMSLTDECVVGSPSVNQTTLFPGNNIHSSTLEEDSRLQLKIQEEIPRCNTFTNEGTLGRSSVVSDLLNNNCGRVAEDNLGLKFAIQQQKPLSNKDVVVRTPVISRFMDSIPSRNSEKESHLQLETQEEMPVAKQKALGRSLEISHPPNNNCSRDVDDNLGLKFETQQKKSYTNESIVGRTSVISRFMNSVHPKILEEVSHIQLDAQEEMRSIDDNALGRSSCDSRPMKNIGTKIIRNDGISCLLDKAEAYGSMEENQGTKKSSCPLFSSKSNSECADPKETSKSWMDEKTQVTSNFRRTAFLPFLPKDKSDRIREGDIYNLRKTAIAQRSAIYKLIRSYSERINHAQQAIRANSIRILNVRETPCEDTTQEVLDIFREIMKLDVDFSDIESCHRKSLGRGAKPIIVRFYSSRIKTMVINDRIRLSGTKIRIEEELSHDRAELLKVASSIFGKKNVGIKNGCIAVILPDKNTMNFSSLSEFRAFLRTSSIRFLNTDDLSDNGLI